jgi:hypothetical protein
MMQQEETLREIWDRIAHSVFVKFRSTTGALIVLRVDHGPFAYKLDDTWFWGRYVPIGFLRTAIPDATTLEALPILDADEALARIRW